MHIIPLKMKAVRERYNAMDAIFGSTTTVTAFQIHLLMTLFFADLVTKNFQYHYVFTYRISLNKRRGSNKRRTPGPFSSLNIISN